MPNLLGPRLVTVCIQGRNKRQHRTRSDRLDLLADVARQIDQRWAGVDAVVLPAGFLRLREPVGALPYPDRVRVLDEAAFVAPVVNAVEALRRSPGVLIAFGVDGRRDPVGDGRDQLCVAIDGSGIVGIGRKIFPVAGREGRSIACFEADFADPCRVVRLTCGARAVLLACYDVFGVAECGAPYAARPRAIRRLGSGQERLTRGDAGFDERLRGCLRGFETLLDGVDVGLAAIHRFRTPATGYWQRHGLATCSAALSGGVAIGAAHFGVLPRAHTSSSLAAAGVPPQHLTRGQHRRAHGRTPDDHFVLPGPPFPALIRLFCF